MPLYVLSSTSYLLHDLAVQVPGLAGGDPPDDAAGHHLPAALLEAIEIVGVQVELDPCEALGLSGSAHRSPERRKGRNR